MIASLKNDKKKIFHLIYDLNLGGAEKILTQILPHLQDNFDNYVVCLQPNGLLAEKIARQIAPVFQLNWRGPKNTIAAFLKFRKLVKKYKPYILSTYLPKADIVGAVFGRLSSVPKLICNIRSTSRHGRFRKVVFFEFLISPLVNRYTINSPAIKDYYLLRYPFPKEKFVYIPNAVNNALFNQSKNLPATKSELKMNHDHHIITCIANLKPSKGHQYLLAAFENTYQQFPHTELLIVGQGKEEKKLKEQTKKYKSRGHIHFLGQRSDVEKILAITNIFVLPTLFEGMSNALLEAMASGKVIVTTDIPENRYLLNNKKTALLIPPKNAGAIAEAIKILLKNPHTMKQLGKAAAARAKDFDTAIVAGRWQKLYESL